jgi:hypothetical protein
VGIEAERGHVLRKQKITISIAVTFTVLSVIGCMILRSPDPRRVAAEAFIRAIANGEEKEAASLLSTSAITAVNAHCPNGDVISCFDEAGLQEWGRLRRVTFTFGDSSSGGNSFLTEWENTALSITVYVVEENGSYVVDGWRIPADIEPGEPISAFPPRE